MFNSQLKKSTKILLMLLFFCVAFLLIFLNKEVVLEKYSVFKNTLEKEKLSANNTINDLSTLTDDIDNSVTEINNKLQNTKNDQESSQTIKETVNSLVKKTNDYINNSFDKKTINDFINSCLENGIESAENCLIKMKDEIISKKEYLPTECQSMDTDNCFELISDFVNTDFVPKEKLDEIKQQIKKLSFTHITVSKKFNKPWEVVQKKLGQEITLEEKTKELIKQAMPVVPQKNETFLIFSSPEDKPYNSSLPAVLMNDSDNDGLPDEMEERLGTSPKKSDTDGDGYDDYTEIKNNYSPNGTEKKNETLSPVEMAIINKKPFEQPISSGQNINEELKIKEIKNKKSLLIFNDGLEISGQAGSNEIIALYIYSTMPIVVTIKTDINGNWVYDFDKKLVDGDHKAYVVINNEQGEIKEKSDMFNFFIKSAIAVDNKEYLKEKIETVDQTKLMIFLYIFAGLLLIVALLAVFIYQIRLMSSIEKSAEKEKTISDSKMFHDYSLNDISEILKRKKDKK